MKATLLVLWMVQAMAAWTSGRELTPAREAHLEMTAREALTVAFADGAATLYADTYARSRSALLMTSVAARESGFDPRIQRHECRGEECDSGNAYCYMQIHLETGVVLSETGDWWFDAKAVDAIHADDLADPASCFRVGEHMLWKALHASRGKNLCRYTGERGNECPAGALRLNQAKDWLKDHPVPFSDEEVLAEFRGVPSN